MTELWTPAVDDELPLLPPELLETLSDDELTAYIEATQVCARHDGAWNLQPKQQQAEDLCERLMGEGDVFELLYGGAGGGGKLLELDTSIPTPSGWTTMGDLRRGDVVFDERGVPTTVVRTHAVDPAPESYRLTFDDGSTINACADHRWLTLDAKELAALTRHNPEWRAARRERRASRAGVRKSALFRETIQRRNAANPPPTTPAPTGTIRTTREIATTLRFGPGDRINHAVPVAGALELPDCDLPLDPYLLGAWLGDGSSGSGGFTGIDPPIWQAFEDAGYRVSHGSNGKSHYVSGLVGQLRAMGVLGAKHVPAVYLRASAKQRLALLQGLMDTDGHACASGAVEFTNTNRNIAESVVELACSLGHKARLSEGRATLYGRDCGPKYRVKWSPPDPVFRLERKVACQRLVHRRTTRFRYIVGCDRIPSVPMRCITVAAPSGLFLAGRSMIPTHNSEWLLFHLYKLALRFPGFSGMLFRRTYGELEKTAILRSLGRFDRRFCTYNATHRRWTFDNGSIIHFAYCEADRDVYQFDSWEGDAIAFDELTQWSTDFPYRYMFSRLRTSIAKSVRGLVPHVIAGTNPHRSGVAWVKPRWIDNSLPLEVVKVESEIEGETEARFIKRVYVPARMSDNRFINASAYRQGLAQLDDATRKAIEDGNWDVIEGQYFGEWSRGLHVIEPFTIPSWWRRIGGYDFGIAAPACHLWTAFDGDGTCYVYREFYKTNMTVPEQAAAIKGAEGPGERVDYRVADPSIWNRTGAGPPISSQFTEAGIPFRRANNARVDGWVRLRAYLRPSVRYQKSEGAPIVLKPKLYIFKTCPNLIRTLPLMVHDDKNPEDAGTDGDDHAPDALRYLIMSRPLQSREPARDRTPEEMREERIRARVRERSGSSEEHPILGTLSR